MAVCLVTGGAGFIGSHLARGLLKCGHEVRVLDNLSAGAPANLSEVIRDIEFIRDDIRDAHAVSIALRNVDCVLHYAAVASVQQSVDSPTQSTDANVVGTVNVLEHSLRAGVRRVLFAASAASELTPRSPPTSPYAVQKHAGELMCQVFSRVFGLETVCLRCFNIFGPRQRPDSGYSPVIPSFITRMIRDERPVIYGDGTQTRDFCYVDNVVQANLLALTSAQVGHGEVLDIGSGESLSLLHLVQRVNAILGSNLEPLFEDGRLGDVKHSCADISLARRLLGYEPSVSLDEGLRRTVESLRRSGGS